VADQPGLKGKLTVIPNGIDFDKPIDLNPVERSALRAEIGLRSDANVLVAMGRLTEQKGYSFLIQAFAELPEARQKQTQLLLMGTGPLESSLRELAESLGLSGRVIFGGYRQDVRRVLSISDVVVFSSLWEGLPIALLEAMASEKCIVATNIEAFRDVVAHESEALLARPADPQDLSAAIERASSDSSLRARLGKRARIRFLKEFTAANMVASYASLYRELLTGEKNPDPES
jgi:glycosyltransferase involved in cell wall biosynthesis